MGGYQISRKRHYVTLESPQNDGMNICKWLTVGNVFRTSCRSILSKHNPRMALAVCMSSGGRQDSRDDNDDCSCNGCPVILQPKKLVQFGRANQRWHFDHATGLIRAFHTNQLDKGMCWIHWEISGPVRPNFWFAQGSLVQMCRGGYLSLQKEWWKRENMQTQPIQVHASPSNCECIRVCEHI